MDLTMPRWGDAMEEGTLLEWLVAAGDRVSRGDPLAVVEADKADGEIEAPADCIVAELLVAEGTTVDVGTALARLEPA